MLGNKEKLNSNLKIGTNVELQGQEAPAVIEEPGEVKPILKGKIL